jgi:hypothetical protein
MTLTNGELILMRDAAERHLPGTAVLYNGGSATLSSDGGGGFTESLTPSGTVSCRLAPVNTRGDLEVELADRIAAEAEWTITLPALTTINTDDLIETGGMNFNVLAVRERSYEVTRIVDCKEID